MKTLIKITLALGAMYVLTGCSGGSSGNNATNPYYSAYGYNGYNTGSTCAPEAQPRGTCPPGQGLGWSNEMGTCLQMAPCVGAVGIAGCRYGYAPSQPTSSACWPVYPF
jgi:hypothetical protein